ncbi:MAG: SRPBCC family protein [Deltaproteobacteria bacterium]|nr:SRPBCC family protein [Deltaproteobacteria bacterium]MBW2420292.1 SRPBCC family protein [Deltaproteobacteria bacterium]
MAIEIEERFQVKAPIEVVWGFMTDPSRVVTCMPGAELVEVVDERNFTGKVKVKIGAITTSYKGKINFSEVDESRRSVTMVAEGREQSGGTLKGTIAFNLVSLPDGEIEFITNANVNLTGRVMQVGRGMIKGVSHQLFLQFVKSAKAQLEVAPGEAGEGALQPAPAAPVEAAPVNALALLFKTLWAGIVNFFRRLFGMKPS